LSFRSAAEESAFAFVLAAQSKDLHLPCRVFFKAPTSDGLIVSGYTPVTYNYFLQKQTKNRLSSPKPT